MKEVLIGGVLALGLLVGLVLVSARPQSQKTCPVACKACPCDSPQCCCKTKCP